MHNEHTIYPTKEEILARLYTPTEREYMNVKTWKTIYFNKKWKNSTLEEKHTALQDLVHTICRARKLTQQEWPTYSAIGETWSYRPSTKHIFAQTENPSIVSALHELGHHLYGTSETDACRFSVGIFTACFPNTYKNLVWEGHMLKKPK